MKQKKTYAIGELDHADNKWKIVLCYYHTGRKEGRKEGNVLIWVITQGAVYPVPIK